MIAPSEIVSTATLDAMTVGALGVVAKVTMLIGLAGAGAFLLRRASAAVRHHVWLLAIVSSLLVPLLAFIPGPVVRFPARWMPQSRVQTPPKSPAPAQQ